MKVVVLGGSPKGQESVTMQYVEFLRIARPDVAMEIRQLARDAKKLERDRAHWDEVVGTIREADLVLWAFPLYILLVCSQMKRFIELLFEREGENTFAGLPCATLSTSIKFYDHTAHEYVRGISEDLGMRFVSGYSAQMRDLNKRANQDQLLAWYSMLEDAVDRDYAEPRRYAPLPVTSNSGPVLALTTAAGTAGADDPDPARSGSPGTRTVILTDAAPDDTVLNYMTERMRSRLAGEEGVVEIHHLSEAGMRGGCMGCMKCGYNYECSYTGKDGFINFFNDVVRPANALVFVGRTKDRYLSATWKQYFDRSFFNTHTPSLIGKQVAFLIGGPLSQLTTLREMLTAWMDVQQAHNSGFASDECDSAQELDRAVDGLAAKLRRATEFDVHVPQTFLGVGGMKIFRDDILGGLRLIFQADHRAYRRMGVYDFPHRRVLARIFVAVISPLLRIRKLREAFYRKLPKVMPMQFRGALAAARKRAVSGAPLAANPSAQISRAAERVMAVPNGSVTEA